MGIALEGQFKIKINETDRVSENNKLFYDIEIVPTKGGGDESKMTSEGRAFLKQLTDVIYDCSTTCSQQIVGKSRDVSGGRYEDGMVNITDVVAFPENGGRTQRGVLTHEVVKQYVKAERGLKNTLEDYYIAHSTALNAENPVNGNKHLEERQKGSTHIMRFLEKDGSITTTTTDLFLESWFETPGTLNVESTNKKPDKNENK